MKTVIRAACGLLLAGACAAVHAAEGGTLLVVEDSLSNIVGEVAPSNFDAASFAAYNTFGSYPAGGAGMSSGQAYAAGAVGGLVGSVIVDGIIQAERNRAIASIRGPLGSGAMRTQVLHSLSMHLAAQGLPVDRRVVAPDASTKIIRRAAGDTKPEKVVLFDTFGTPMVALSSNDRSVIVRVDLAVHRREGGGYERERKVRVGYASVKAPAEAPKAWWAEDNGRRVLETVDQAIGRIVEVALAEGSAQLPEIGRDDSVQITVDDTTAPVNARLLREDGTHVYLAMPGQWIAIVPGKVARDLSPADAIGTAAAP